MKLAVVGSRDFSKTGNIIPLLEQVLEAEKRTGQSLTIVSGGAQGPDLIAQRWAESKGLPVEIFLADWEEHGDAAGPKRNGQIVEACERMLAFWDGLSTGTLDAICRAKKAGKVVTVILA